MKPWGLLLEKQLGQCDSCVRMPLKRVPEGAPQGVLCVREAVVSHTEDRQRGFTWGSQAQVNCN